MGKMILCSGSRAVRPYVFSATGTRIYSIEELCYYLSSHIYYVDEDIFSDPLIEWIGTDLGLTSRAEKLVHLKEQQADLKTLMTAVLCSADYFSEQEIKNLIKMVDELSGMPPLKRNCMRANSYLYDYKFSEAAGEYERILKSKEAAGLTPEEYGDVLHNLAVAKVHIRGLKEASEIFLQAYERNRREESLRQYLYTLWLGNKTEYLREKLEEYQVEGSLYEDIVLQMDQLTTEADSSDGVARIGQLKKLRAEGRMTEFQRMRDDIIESWITSVRRL